MSRFSSLLFGLTLFAVPASSVQAQDAPADTPSATLKLEVRRVPLDIVVTDKDGNSVRGLKESDFIIKEDGKPQTPLSFEYLDGASNSFVPPKLPPLPVNTFVDEPTQPERGPLYVLYYDMVNTPIEDQMSFHHQLVDFVNKAPAGARMAVFVNAHGVHLIQGFTSDRAILRAAIQSQGPGPHIPNVLSDGNLYGRYDAGAVLSNMKFLAQYLEGMPGRKNLLWLSSNFPIPVGATMTGYNSDTGVSGGFSSSTPQLNDLTYLESESIKKTYSAMMRSQVCLYPIDLRGANADIDATENSFQYEDAIAAATGGQAYHGDNNIDKLLNRAVDEGASYYSLTYSPTNRDYNGLPRHIQVSLTGKPGDTLSYRTLYYGVADDQPQPEARPSDVLQARFEAAKTADNLYANMEHGAPMLHDLVFSAHVATEGNPKMASAKQMAELEDSPAFFRVRHRDKPQKPLAPVKLQKYRIGYGVMDAALKPAANGQAVPATLEFAAAAYDADGRLLNSELNEGVVSAGAGKSGDLFHGEQELEVPPGAASLRLAVRDKLSNRTGTLELPLPLQPAPKSPGKGD